MTTLAAIGILSVASAATTVPNELVGEWRYGRINATTFWDAGTYKGHGGGISMTYVFDKDGSVKRYFYAETNNYGWRTQTFGVLEGQVVVDGHTFRIKPIKGHFKVTGNTSSSKKIDRDMTKEELAKEAKSRYIWHPGKDENGKRILRIGNSEDALASYQRAEK